MSQLGFASPEQIQIVIIIRQATTNHYALAHPTQQIVNQGLPKVGSHLTNVNMVSLDDIEIGTDHSEVLLEECTNQNS